MRVVAFIASIAVVVWAAVAVPMPFRQTVPGRATPVENLVSVSAASTEINGDLSLLTVRSRDVQPVDLLVAGLRPGRQLEPVSNVRPSGIDQGTWRDFLASEFENSFTTAVAVAAEYAGHPVEVSTEVIVASVLDDGPAAGVLLAGDRIRAVDGRQVATADQLVRALGRVDGTGPVALEVVRDGEQLSIDATLGILPGTDRLGIGIIPSTITAPVELPFDVQIADSNIIGPSAGMMIAVTVADLLLEEDLAAGRVIVGTGEIDGTGRIIQIGSIEQKVETAVEAGADVMLVPAEQAAEARAAAGDRVEVIGAATLDEAVTALRGDGVAAG